MADNIKVKPTPIQRNRFDVATELTQLYFEKFGVENEDHIKRVFTEYYSLAVQLEITAFNDASKLKEFLPEDIKNNTY